MLKFSWVPKILAMSSAFNWFGFFAVTPCELFVIVRLRICGGIDLELPEAPPLLLAGRKAVFPTGVFCSIVAVA